MRLLLAICACAAMGAGADEPLLLQKPTLSKTHIVFAYAGDLWSVPREGGDAVLLTSGSGNETDPAFSPDGKRVAFTGDYDGNVDVFVVECVLSRISESASARERTSAHEIAPAIPKPN